MSYRIYQVKRDKMHDFGFESFEDAERYNGKGSIVKDNYDMIYEFDMYSSEDIKLDEIYDIFNLHKPDDFPGHSMSVSDVVENDGNFWYCDSIGWKKLDWEKGGND